MARRNQYADKCRKCKDPVPPGDGFFHGYTERRHLRDDGGYYWTHPAIVWCSVCQAIHDHDQDATVHASSAPAPAFGGAS